MHNVWCAESTRVPTFICGGILGIIGLQRGNVGNYYVSGILAIKLILRGSFVINRGDWGARRYHENC